MIFNFTIFPSDLKKTQIQIYAFLNQFSIYQLIRFARVSSHVADFNTRNKILTAKLLKQGYRYHKLHHYDLVSKFNTDSNLGKQKSPGRAISKSRIQPPTPGGREKVTQINVCPSSPSKVIKMLKRQKKHIDKEQDKTKPEALRSVNYKAIQNKNNIGTTALERSIV